MTSADRLPATKKQKTRAIKKECLIQLAASEMSLTDLVFVCVDAIAALQDSKKTPGKFSEVIKTISPLKAWRESKMAEVKACKSIDDIKKVKTKYR